LLARSAEDAAQLLAAFTPQDGSGASIDEDGVRMALHLPEAVIEDDVGSALESFAHAVQASSAGVSSATVTSLGDLAEIVLRVEAARTHGEALQEGRAPAAVETIARAGLAIPGDWYLAALRDRPRRTADFVARHLNEFDVLAVPALPTTVPDWDAVTPGHARFDRRALLGLHRFMGFVNYLGLPAVCLPVAVDTRGLPISVQLIGRPFSERLLLRVASRIERRHFSFEASSPLCSKE
jgi:aspartyl-tRNA(Asn)/glutamyl-tRNA(Gln) amidotransferase subunit A